MIHCKGNAGWKKKAVVFFVIAEFLATMVTYSFAGNVDKAAVRPRPRIGLVLSGGGARGAAHVGVLKVLKELRVPIDYIAGTSMGAIVGGSYASGNSIDEMLIQISTIKSAELFTDKPPRKDISIRRKEDDLRNYIGPELGVQHGALLLPKGLVSGVGLEAVLRNLAKIKGKSDFDTFPIPFRAVATDIETGKMVVFRSGDLAAVMRASMSVPGAVAPAVIDGRVLVDGGLTRNLPVDVAREMGADIIIAVNLGTPLMKRDQINSLLGVTGQMIHVLTEQNVQASLALLKPDDILIEPELGDYSAGDFDHMPSTVPIGEAAARKVEALLRRYSLSPQEYAEYRHRHRGEEVVDNRPVDEIRVEGLHRVNPEVVLEEMETKVGKPLDTKVVNADMLRIYGRGDFEHIGYTLTEESGKRILIVKAQEKSWGPDYLLLGLDLSTDFKGDSFFDLFASYRRTWLNKLGGEWRSYLQIGQATQFYSEFYQPLFVNQYIFVAPMLEYTEQLKSVFQEGVIVARYLNRSTTLGLDLGSQFTRYGELRIGLVKGPQSFSLDTGIPSLATAPGKVDIGAVRVRARFDQLDSVNFPRHGYAATVEIFDSHTGLGASDNYTRWEGNFLSAFSFGANTVQLALIGGGQIGSDPLPVYDFFSFGGFLRLSGYRTGQFLGDSLAFGRLMYYRRVAKVMLLEGVYAGFSLEAGRIGGQPVPGGPTGTLGSGALILAADTPLGPAYFAYGIAEHDNRSFYLYLGKPWF
jgi:NTE family protein